MSRGDRVIVTGNLSKSMRENYQILGVDTYYTQVASTYRNPHFPGIQSSIYQWLNYSSQNARTYAISNDSDSWWTNVGETLNKPLHVLDLAAGSGEVTISVLSWWRQATVPQSTTFPGIKTAPIPIDNECMKHRPPKVYATDPYTSEAYQARTGLACCSLSFTDIAEGRYPWDEDFDVPLSDEMMTICSFALHLANPSSLFSLLYSLSRRSKWLVILAPHKKPEIKNGWGWIPWDPKNWRENTESIASEILLERVRCRVYQSTNFVPERPE